MRRLTYVLQFHRPPKSGEQSEQAVASSVQITTTIDADGVDGAFSPLSGETAVLTNDFALDKSGTLFFEWGSIAFGGPMNSLSFSSIGAGTLLGAPDADGFTQGVVLWRVDGGTGAFAGASGAITSNFLVNLETEELIDNQLHLIYLPE